MSEKQKEMKKDEWVPVVALGGEAGEVAVHRQDLHLNVVSTLH